MFNFDALIYSEPRMEDVLKRFPHIGVQIFEKLNDKSLVRSILVAKSWKNFIDENQFPWNRIQKKYTSSHGYVFNNFCLIIKFYCSIYVKRKHCFL